MSHAPSSQNLNDEDAELAAAIAASLEQHEHEVAQKEADDLRQKESREQADQISSKLNNNPD